MQKNRKVEAWIFLIVMAVLFMLPVIAMFPVIRFNDNRILMFAPGRLGSGGRGFNGWVFGNHILETERGEITLRNLARILAGGGGSTVGIVRARTFERGRASHNLVVEGMVMPQNIEIIFNSYTQQIRTLILYDGAWQDRPEIIVSGISFTIARIDFNTTNRRQGGGMLILLRISLRPGMLH